MFSQTSIVKVFADQSEVSALPVGCMKQSEVSALPAGSHSLSTRSEFNQLTCTREKGTRPHITQKTLLGLVTQVFAFMHENNSLLS